MRGTKTRKALKIVFIAAILLTATTATIISTQNQNQNTNPLINLYLQGIYPIPSTVIRPKMGINDTTTLNGSIYYEPIVVTADNIVIDGNGSTVQGSGSGDGFYLDGRSNVTIFNVVVIGWYNGFHLYNSSNNNLSGNTANSNTFDGFHIESSLNNTFSGNTANNNTHSGFRLYSKSDNNTLSGNTANNNLGINGGFDIDNSSYIILSGNTANNNQIGFKLWADSYNNNLSGNTANNNQFAGFFLEGGSGNSTLSGNSATNNKYYGFYLWASSYNNITGNTAVDFWGNGFYVDPYNSHDNIIENNTVIATGLPLFFIILYRFAPQSHMDPSWWVLASNFLTLVWNTQTPYFFIILYILAQRISQSSLDPSIAPLVELIVVLVIVELVCWFAYYKRRKVAVASHGETGFEQYKPK